MGGEQSLLPGIKFAERFADYGITGLAVSLYGAEGLSDGINEIPLEMFVTAVDYLNGLMPNRQREKKLYRMILLIGLMYKTFGKYRKENMEYFEQTEREVIDWIS